VLAMSDMGQSAQKSEIENRILLAAALPADATHVQIDFQPAAPPPDSIFFPDAFFLAKSLRTLISSSRALSPQDMTVPEVTAAKAGGVVTAAELRARAKKAAQDLQTAVTNLNTAAVGLPAAPNPVRDALLACSFFGVAGSIPYSSSGPDPRLADQAASVASFCRTAWTTLPSQI
jgi:hypothetical protein